MTTQTIRQTTTAANAAYFIMCKKHEGYRLVHSERIGQLVTMTFERVR